MQLFWEQFVHTFSASGRLSEIPNNPSSRKPEPYYIFSCSYLYSAQLWVQHCWMDFGDLSKHGSIQTLTWVQSSNVKSQYLPGCAGGSLSSQLLDLLKIPKWKRKWTVLPLFLLGSDAIYCRCSILHWIRATAGWVRAGVRSSTLPSTGTASSTQSHNERHSQLCRPARWHFHQSKPGWRQILNY